MATTVALVGVTHPHARMYLDTLDALDEVVGVVLAIPMRWRQARSRRGYRK